MKTAGKITSTKNQKIIDILRLEKKKEREQQRLFLVEGWKETCMALEAGYSGKSIFFCPEILSPLKVEELAEKNNFNGDIYEISPEVYARIAYREGTEGICMLAEIQPMFIRQLVLPANPLIVLVESVEKPGNLGAILRTADAAGVHAVIVSDPQTDLYNPNVVRASRGCLFTVKSVVCSKEEALDFFHSNKIRSFAAALPAEKYYHETDFTGSSAILFGTEAQGLSKFWLNNADELIKIPMLGKADSLNVSTSAAIIVYEAMRQRGFR